jgi:hypothetical protein
MSWWLGDGDHRTYLRKFVRVLAPGPYIAQAARPPERIEPLLGKTTTELVFGEETTAHPFIVKRIWGPDR